MSSVEYFMENMLPELEDFRKRQVFSDEEIEEIVQNRRRYEHMLQRRVVNTEDYIRYIYYELNLASIVSERRGKEGERSKKALCDVCIPRRIHSIFRRALKKRSGDKSLWLTFIDISFKLESFKALSKIYAQVIQKMPSEVGFWIMAASFEVNTKKDFVSARGIFQRAFRFHPDSELLWCEYFRFELLYSEWRCLLAKEEGTSIGMGALPIAVVKAASNVQPKWSLICRMFGIFDECANGKDGYFPQVERFLIDYVKNTMVRVYPESISFLAMRLIPLSEDSVSDFSVGDFILFLNEVLETTPSPEVLVEMVHFVNRIYLFIKNQPDCGGFDGSEALLVERTLGCFLYAKENGLVSQMFLETFLKLDFLPIEEKSEIVKCGLCMFPTSISLWRFKFLFDRPLVDIVMFLKEAKKSLGETLPCLVEIILEECLADFEFLDLVRIIKICSTNREILGMLVEKTLERFKKDIGASVVYEELVRGGVCLSSCGMCLLFANASLCPDFSKKMYERALVASPGSRQAFLSYLSFFLRQGNLKEAGTVYKRCVSSLSPAELDVFQTQYSDLMRMIS